MPPPTPPPQKTTQHFIKISIGFVCQSTNRKASQLGKNFSASGRHGFCSTWGQLTFSFASLRHRKQCSLTPYSICTSTIVQRSLYYPYWTPFIPPNSLFFAILEPHSDHGLTSEVLLSHLRHTTLTRDIHVPRAGFEPAIPASERLQISAP